MTSEQPVEKGTVSFKCPNCLKYELKRTAHQRKLAARYVCPMCGFTGPN